MKLAQKLFFRLIAFILLFFIFSCIHTQEEFKNQLSFVVDEDTMWKIMVKVFKSYPLKNIDPQIGYIETELIKGDQVWKAPYQADSYGYSYTIQAYLNYNEPVSNVNIHKKVYKQKGFISEKKEVPSDYLEEAILFYHILRELELRKQLDL